MPLLFLILQFMVKSKKHFENNLPLINRYTFSFLILFFQVCHSKKGDINPTKIQKLVKGYVRKYKHARKPRNMAQT